MSLLLSLRYAVQRYIPTWGLNSRRVEKGGYQLENGYNNSSKKNDEEAKTISSSSRRSSHFLFFFSRIRHIQRIAIFALFMTLAILASIIYILHHYRVNSNPHIYHLRGFNNKDILLSPPALTSVQSNQDISSQTDIQNDSTSTSTSSIQYIILYNHQWNQDIHKANLGGPKGELFLYDTVYSSLLYLNQQAAKLSQIQYTILKIGDEKQLKETLDRISQESKENLRSVNNTVKSSSLLALYTQSVDVFQYDQLYSHPILQRCQYRLLDYWGTPPNQNRLHFHPNQFLTPYDYGYNTHMGFVISSPSNNNISELVLAEEQAKILPPINSLTPHPEQQQLQPREPYENQWLRSYLLPTPSPPLRVCLWGKLPHYFHQKIWSRLSSLINSLNDTIEIHATIGPSSTDEWQKGKIEEIPSFVHNSGVLTNKSDWSTFLSSCTLLLGVGDPVLGPTVFEALAHGVRYIDFKYVSPRKLFQNRRYLLSSQHQFAREMIGSPLVEEMQWESEKEFQSTIRRILKSLPKERRGYIHPTHRVEMVAARIEGNIRDPTICQAKVPVEVETVDVERVKRLKAEAEIFQRLQNLIKGS